MMNAKSHARMRLVSAKTATAVRWDTLDGWLDRECHGLMLTVKDPAMANVHAKRVRPWRKLAQYLDRMGQQEADLLCVRLYAYCQRRRGMEPPTGEAA